MRRDDQGLLSLEVLSGSRVGDENNNKMMLMNLDP